MPPLRFVVDDLTGEATRALVERHLADMLDEERGEIKSMRVADAYVGRGIGRAILDHLIAEARKRPFDGYADDPFSVFMTRAV